MKKSKSSKRGYIQIFFFVLIGIISINHSLAEAGKGFAFLSDASLHALCPFGGVVTLFNLFTLGSFIPKIHMSSVILMGIVFALAIFLGPVFCGFICPFGTFQEWIGKIGKKIWKKKYNTFIPRKIHNILIWFRYIVLIMVVYITAKSGYLVFSEIDPYNALFTFWTEDVSIKALVALIVVLIATLFVERPWCKYACPYGALLGLSNKIRIFKIKRNKNTCINCNRCSNTCPMMIDVAQKEVVTNLQCISCFECTSERSCPVLDTVNMETGRLNDGKKWRLHITKASIIMLLLFFGGILATITADVWTTEKAKEPAKYLEGVAVGKYNPDDIKGSYSFEEISEFFDIDLQVLFEAFGISKETSGNEIKTKDLKEIYADIPVEIGNESVKVFVALYKNLPVELEEIYLPDSAIKILMELPTEWTEEQLEHFKEYSVDIN